MQHHVYFWLKEEFQSDEEKAAFEAALTKLNTIENIGALKGFGKPAATAPRPVIDSSYDYCLYQSFDSMEQHDIYQEHPTHIEFIEGNKHRWEKVLVMDSE